MHAPFWSRDVIGRFQIPSALLYGVTTLADLPEGRAKSDASQVNSKRGSRTTIQHSIGLGWKWEVWELTELCVRLHDEDVDSAIATTQAKLSSLSPSLDSIDPAFIERARRLLREAYLRSAFNTRKSSPSADEDGEFIEADEDEEYPESSSHEQASAPAGAKRGAQHWLLANEEIAARERVLNHLGGPLFNLSQAKHGGMEVGHWLPTPPIRAIKAHLDETQAEIVCEKRVDSNERSKLEASLLALFKMAATLHSEHTGHAASTPTAAAAAAADAARVVSLEVSYPVLLLASDITKDELEGKAFWSQLPQVACSQLFSNLCRQAGLEQPACMSVSVRLRVA